MRRNRWLYHVLCLGGLVFGPLTIPSSGYTQELAQHDVNRIVLEAERAFAHMVGLWKDRRFAELYSYGTFASQVDLSPEAFAHHMSRATRTLQCCWQTMQDVSSRFDSPERVYIKARLGFNNKEFLVVRGQHRFIARGFLAEETLTFLLQHEEDAWRIDLFHILALSGVPLEFPGPFLFPFRQY
jgi:hypothetical protein